MQTSEGEPHPLACTAGLKIRGALPPKSYDWGGGGGRPPPPPPPPQPPWFLRQCISTSTYYGEGKVSCLWVLIAQSCHSKVSHFGSHIADQQHVIAGEISVDDAIGVEK